MNLRAAIAGLTLAAASLTPAVATEVATPPRPTAYALFRSVCVGNRAEKAAVLASPELKGWLNLPLPMSPKIENGRLIDKALRVKTEGERMTVVMVSRGEVNAKGRKIPFLNCTVAYKPGELAPTRNSIQAWLGFAPMDLPKGAIGFHYAERGGVRTPLRVAKLSDLPAQPAGTRVVAITLKVEKGVLAVSYTLPRL